MTVDRPLFAQFANPAGPPEAFSQLPGSDPAKLARVGSETAARLAADPRAERLPALNLTMFAVRDFLSPEECAELIALIDADVSPSTSLRPGTPSRRSSETCQLDSTEAAVAAVERRISDLLGLPPSQGEAVQGQRYKPGQRYLLHNDYFAGGQVYSEAVAAEGGQRTWTAMVYLQAPLGGGRTRFPYAEIEACPVPGTLLTWNNMGEHGMPNGYAHHAAMPTEAGLKHVLTKWYREREWQGHGASVAFRS